MHNTIKFYRTSDEYGEFSNFYAQPIRIDGKVWPTSEHYFQAMKFESTVEQEAVRKAKSPMEAAKMGRNRRKKIKRNWDSIKDNVMRKAVYAKFSQTNALKKLLASTTDAKLIEDTKNDSYWGNGPDGKGKNMLGKILMETREKFITMKDNC